MNETNQEKRKTLADIADEIRRAVESMGDEVPYTVSTGTMRMIADRIEAIDNANARRSPYTPGNAAAMREALETIHDKVNRLDEECGVDPVEIRDIARAALSAPARNCDMYATYAEAAEAHNEYATAYIMRASNKFDFPMEFDEWLFAPAAEQKGAGDGR